MSRPLFVALFSVFMATAHAEQLPDKAKADADFWAKERRQEQQRVKELHAKAKAMPNKHYSASSGGCGSRGGPGWRRAAGKCASWRD